MTVTGLVSNPFDLGKRGAVMLALAPVLVLALVAMLGTATRADANPVQRTPPPAFAQCTGCHSVQPGRNLFGPSLSRIAGRKAGSLPGYSYSDSLRKSGIVWNEAALDRWLTGPRKMVPGTKMPFPGISDPTRRKEVVSYLLTLQ